MGTAERLLGILQDRRADDGDRLVAASLAGDTTVMNDEIARTLVAIAASGEEPEELRAAAAIAMGPVLEQANFEGFELSEYLDDLLISEGTFRYVQQLLGEVYRDQEAAPEAVEAAAERELEAAWPLVAGLIRSDNPDKVVLLAAISAAMRLNPTEAYEPISSLEVGDDDELAEAVMEALTEISPIPDLDQDGLDFDLDDEDFEGEDEGVRKLLAEHEEKQPS